MIHFLTFGAGSQEYLNAVDRIVNQANSLGVFTSITGLTDKDLKADTLFWDKHGSFIEQSSRGYGYWIWKPYSILKALEALPDGDILMYLDSGCELDVSKVSEINSYIEHVKHHGLWGTRGSPCDSSNDIRYCKRDTSIKYNLDISALKKGHIQASIHIILKCDATLKIIREWYSDCQDYHCISDAPSVNKNFAEFIDHRHDQSIYNLILKKYKLEDSIIYNGEISLIKIAHNRSGVSTLNR
jgi:hypothetical protein